ncbi:MAG: hypothetical protein QXO51_05390 [Halobacteria archaeon]
MADLLLFLPRTNYARIRDALLKDDPVSRAGIQFQDSKALPSSRDGVYCVVSAPEPVTERAKSIAAGAEVVTGAERDRVLQAVKSQGDAAAEGFGAIFG